jgi:hypothetical protein
MIPNGYVPNGMGLSEALKLRESDPKYMDLSYKPWAFM